MNLQRREEIRELANWLDSSEWSSATECQDAIRELLAHIDTLEQTAAERVIARGAAVKPHTFAEIVNQVRDIANQYAGTEQLRERIAYALTPHFERNGGPTPDYTGEGSAWVPPVEAPAVVVPKLTKSTVEEIAEAETRVGSDGPFASREQAALAEVGSYIRRLRAIPADRVLGEGMLQVDRRIIEKFTSGCGEWMPGLGRCGDQYPGGERQLCAKCVPLRDALRANQGGAEG